MLNASRLRVFREVVEQGSFSAAADALAYSQSAVSQAIATLEGELGTPLIERRRGGVRPTPAGAALAAHAGGILARMQAAEEEVAAIARGRGGRLRIASFPTAGAALMPRVIAAFRASHPEEIRVPLAKAGDEAGPRVVTERRQPGGGPWRPRRPAVGERVARDDVDVAGVGSPRADGDAAVDGRRGVPNLSRPRARVSVAGPGDP